MRVNTKRRLRDQFGKIGQEPTFIGERGHLVADLEVTGALISSGTVRGDADVHGLFHLTTTGRWQGEIHADSAIIDGHLDGALEITGKLEVGAMAIIRGRVLTHTLALARGAIMDGEVSITSGQPAHTFDEMRTPPKTRI